MEMPKDNPERILERALLSWIQEFAPYGVFTLDTALRVQSWNRWMESHSPFARTEVAGRSLFEIFPDLEERKLTMPFQRALDGESSVLSTALHRYLLPFKSPLSDREGDRMRQTARIAPMYSDRNVCGVIVMIEDVTQRENQAESLVRQHRRDEALSWALVHLLKSDDPRKTVRQLFFKIAEHLDFDTFFLYLRDVESGAIKLHTAGGISDDSQQRCLTYELLSNIANEQEAVIFDAVKNRQEAEYALLKEAKISSAIVIPLGVHDKSLGSLCFASWSRDHISPEESDLLTTIAQYLATVRPGHAQFIEPSRRFADVIFPQGGLNEPALDLLLACAREFTNERSSSADRVTPTS
jgi:PAS domain S-box-containing protein